MILGSFSMQLFKEPSFWVDSTTFGNLALAGFEPGSIWEHAPRSDLASGNSANDHSAIASSPKKLDLTTEVIPMPLPTCIAIRDDDVEVDPIFDGFRYFSVFGSPHALFLGVC